MVAEIATAKTGKHGAAKTLVTFIDSATGLKKYKMMLKNDVLEVITSAKKLNSYFKKSFDDLVMGQSSTQGSWQDESLVLSFFKDPKGLDALKDFFEDISDNGIKKKVWLTVLAIYVFSKFFESKSDEWNLIVQKGYKYLRG
jgi:hypothetical protein